MSTPENAPTTPAPLPDVLDEDPPLRGQNYACVSFLSPEDVLDNKEVFFVSKFLEDLSGQLRFLLDGLETVYPEKKGSINNLRETHAHFFKHSEMQEQYRFFKSKHQADLDEQFHRENEFRTSVRGFKIRGVFETVKEAEVRAQVLKRMGDKHNIFVAQVGCWVPWDPRADQISDQRYAEEQLNVLMTEYQKHMQVRDQAYEQRKKEKIDTAAMERDAWLERVRSQNGASTSGASGSGSAQVTEVAEVTNELITAPSAQPEPASEPEPTA